MALFGFLRRAEPDTAPVDGIQDEAVAVPTLEEIRAAELESARNQIRRSLENFGFAKKRRFVNLFRYGTSTEVDMFMTAAIAVANEDPRILGLVPHSFVAGEARLHGKRLNSINVLATLQL